MTAERFPARGGKPETGQMRRVAHRRRAPKKLEHRSERDHVFGISKRKRSSSAGGECSRGNPMRKGMVEKAAARAKS